MIVTLYCLNKFRFVVELTTGTELESSIDWHQASETIRASQAKNTQNAIKDD
jgi:hypothetical protein